MIRRMLGMLAVIAIGLSGAAASAHQDPNADGGHGAGNDNNAKRCDTYYRSGHSKDAQGDPDRKDMDGDGIPDKNPAFDPNSGHSEDHTDTYSDQGDVGRIAQKNGAPVGADSGVYVHSHTGHYVVRHNAFYVEVIGGGGYSRNGNQGGIVQGEVDPGAGQPDADFNVGTFAGTNGAMHAEHACVAAAGQNQIGDEGEQP